jgi:hypothetical protein
MDYPLFEDVIVLTDLPDEGILAGDIGVVVDRHEVAGLETGYSVEFFDLAGNTVAVALLPESKLRRPSAADRPMARRQPYAPHAAPTPSFAN